MGKGSASSGALTPLRPVSELIDHLQQVTGGPVDAAVLWGAAGHGGGGFSFAYALMYTEEMAASPRPSSAVL